MIENSGMEYNRPRMLFMMFAMVFVLFAFFFMNIIMKKRFRIFILDNPNPN